jgi:hypothetical protein
MRHSEYQNVQTNFDENRNFIHLILYRIVRIRSGPGIQKLYWCICNLTLKLIIHFFSGKYDLRYVIKMSGMVGIIFN